ncbi:MAG: hypothetical protein OEZ02_02570 [Anaerolineae bacterium]|nr:hypothetical protein [Anaerolineae bacterium]
MGKQEQKVLAIFLIAIGFILLAARLIHIDPHSLFWPLLLISLGLVFIFRPNRSLQPAPPRLSLSERFRAMAPGSSPMSKSWGLSTNWT